MLPFLRSEFGNPSSPYSFSRGVKKAIADARAQIAECIGAFPEEIYFTSGGSESNNWAIKNFIFSEFHRQRQILISPIEHHAVLNTCVEAAKRFGFTIISTPVDSTGKVILPLYRENVSEHINGISIMLANEAPRPKGRGIGDFARYRERPAFRRWTAPGKVPVPSTKLLFALRKTISELLKGDPRVAVLNPLESNCVYTFVLAVCENAEIHCRYLW